MKNGGGEPYDVTVRECGRRSSAVVAVACRAGGPPSSDDHEPSRYLYNENLRDRVVVPVEGAVRAKEHHHATAGVHKNGTGPKRAVGVRISQLPKKSYCIIKLMKKTGKAGEGRCGS